MTDLQKIELNVNACIIKINKMYKILAINLVSFKEGQLIYAFGAITSINASLVTLEKLRKNDMDIYLFNKVDEAIIDVFINELNQALFSITFLYEEQKTKSIK